MPEPSDTPTSADYVTHQTLTVTSAAEVNMTAVTSHVVMEVASLVSDDKKRPLSVGSVSSSSSSSLPRHQRKKLATCVTSVYANGGAQCNESIEEDDDVSCDVDLDDVTSANQMCDVMNRNVVDDEQDDEEVTPTSSPHQERHKDKCASPETRDDVTNTPETQAHASPRSSYVAFCAAHARAPRTTQPSVANARTDTTCDVTTLPPSLPSPLQLPPPSPPPVPPPTPTSKAWPSQIVKGVQEILSTERTYVRDLQDIVQVSVFTRELAMWTVLSRRQQI